MQVSNSEISVLVNGVYDEKVTPILLKSIHKKLPNSKIILTTWENSKIPQEIAVLCNKIVYNKDPGFEYNDPNRKIENNILRILYSIEQGLKYCDGKYILRLRSDMVIFNTNFLKEFNKFKKRDTKMSLFKRKIIAHSFVTTDFIEQNSYKHFTPFHISDWYHFGFEEDIKELYNLPPIENIIEYSRYFETHERIEPYDMDCLNQRLWKFPVEQYIGVNNAKKIIKNLDFPHFQFYKKVDLDLSRSFIVNNFIILETAQSGIGILKDRYKKINKSLLKNLHPYLYNGLWTYERYKVFYNKYNTSFIKSTDISVVVQGAINAKNTKMSLETIRKNLPQAEIILSTWENSDTTSLSDYDIIIFNKDIKKDKRQEGKNSNVARHIYCTFAGIKKATRKYVLKIRSDIALNDTTFLNSFDKYNNFEENYRVFKKRIIISSFFTRNSSVSNWIYHPSDWCYFGLREDMYNLFDIPLPEEENNFYLEKNPPANKEYFNSGMTVRYWSEQYIFVECLLKNKKQIDFKDYTDLTPLSRFKSEHYILNNFVVLDYQNGFNITFLKYPMKEEWCQGRLEILNFEKWEKQYFKNCEPKIKYVLYKIRKNLKWEKILKKRF